MLIKKIFIDKEIKFKIYNKHNIKFKEIEQVLLSKNYFIKKTKDEKYIAFCKNKRYLTIIFAFEKGVAIIITAYPSSKWQINLFQRRIKK